MSIGLVAAAVGQCFFSLNIGTTGMVNYGSYLPDSENIPSSTVKIVIADFVVAFLAGLIIIPSAFAFGIDVGSGPSLLFVTMPSLFARLPMPWLWNLLFFVLLLFASVFGIQLNQMLFLWGLSLTSPIDTSIIATIVPVLTMVLATLFLREPITWLKAGGVLLGCGGALLLILVSRHGTGGTSSVAGDVLCVISAVSYATYLTAFRNVIVKYSPVTTMKWMFLFAAVAAVAIYYRPLAGVDYAALAPRTWAGIGYVVVCSTFLSYFMVPIGQRYLRPTVVSMYNYVQPLVAVLFTVAVGLDTFGFTKGVAALCVFAGVWLVTKSKSRAQLDAERAAAGQAPENRPRA